MIYVCERLYPSINIKPSSLEVVLRTFIKPQNIIQGFMVVLRTALRPNWIGTDTWVVNVALPCQLVLFRFYTGYHLQLPTNKTSFPTFIFLWSKFQTQTQKYVKLRSAHTEPHRMQTFIVRLYMKICLNSMSKTSDFCNTRKSSGQPPFALSMNCANISRNFFVEWIVLFDFFVKIDE